MDYYQKALAAFGVFPFKQGVVYFPFQHIVTLLCYTYYIGF